MNAHERKQLVRGRAYAKKLNRIKITPIRPIVIKSWRRTDSTSVAESFRGCALLEYTEDGKTRKVKVSGPSKSGTWLSAMNIKRQAHRIVEWNMKYRWLDHTSDINQAQRDLIARVEKAIEASMKMDQPKKLQKRLSIANKLKLSNEQRRSRQWCKSRLTEVFERHSDSGILTEEFIVAVYRDYVVKNVMES